MIESLTFLITQVRKSQWHAAVIIIGMTLAVAFSVGITTIVSAVNEDFNETKRGPSHVDITIEARNGSSFNFESVRRQINEVGGIKVVTPALQWTFEANNFTQRESNFTVKILGIDPETHPDLSRIKLFSGEANLTSGRVIVSQALLTRLAIKVGTAFNVLGKIFVVSGIFDNVKQRVFGAQDVTNLLVLNINDFRELLGLDERSVNAIHVEVQSIISVEQVKDEIALVLGDRFEVIQQVSITALDKLAISSYGTTMATIIMITIFTEFVFLLNLFLIVVNDRQKTLGLLRALGLNRFQVIISFLIEVSVFGLISTLLGLLIGHLMASTLLRYLLTSQGLTLLHPIVIKPSDLIFALGVGLGVGLIAAMYPMLTLLKLNVALTLNERKMLHSGTSVSLSSITWLAIGGMLLGGMITFLTYQGTQNKILSMQLDSEPAILALGSALLLLLATSISSLLLTLAFNRVARRSSRLVSFFIATRNILRYRIRSITSILTNGLAFAFALVIIILTASLATSVPTWFEESYPNADMVIHIDQKNPLYRENVVNISSAHPNINDVIFIQNIKATPLNQHVIIDVNGINASEFESYGPRVLQGAGYSSLLQSSTSALPVLISESLATILQIDINDRMTISLIDASTVKFTVRVIGVVADSVFSPSTNPLQMYIHYQNLEHAVGEIKAPLRYILVTLKDKKIVEDVRITLMDRFPEIESISIVQQILEELSEAIQRQKALLQALSIQAFLIAIITQFISIILSTENSRREIGILRALGISSTGSFAVFFLEGLTLSVLGMGVGLINGMLGAIIVSWYVQQVTQPLALHFDLLELSSWSILYLVLTTIAITYPATKITELSPIEALDERAQVLTGRLTQRRRIRALSFQNLLILSFWSFLYLTGLLILPLAIELMPIPDAAKTVFLLATMLASIGFITLGGIYLASQNVFYIKDHLVAYQKHYQLDALSQKILGLDNVESATLKQKRIMLTFPSHIYIPWHVKVQVILGALFKRGSIQLSTILNVYKQPLKKALYYGLMYMNTLLLLGLLHLVEDPMAFMISISSESTYLAMLFTVILLVLLGVILTFPLTTFLLQTTWQLDPDIHPLIHYFVRRLDSPYVNIASKLLIILLTRFILKSLFDSLLTPVYSSLLLDCVLVFLFYQLGMNFFLSRYEQVLVEGDNIDKLSVWKAKESVIS